MRLIDVATRRIRGHIDELRGRRVRGWAVDRFHKHEALIIDIIVDKNIISSNVANQSRPDITSLGISAAHGFDFNVDIDLDEIGDSLEVVARRQSSRRNRSSRTNLPGFKTAVGPSTTTLSQIAERKLRHDMKRLQRPLIIIDISDLILFLRTHSTVTGIQRVVSALMGELTLSKIYPKGHTICFSLVYIDSLEDSQVAILHESHVKQLVDKMQRGWKHTDYGRFVDSMESNAYHYRVKTNDIVFLPGAYWIVPRFLERLGTIRRRSPETKIVSFVHDIIPMTHPQWVPHQAIADVTGQAAEFFRLTDQFITNSVFVADQLESTIKFEMGRSPSIRPVLLPHELPQSKNLPPQSTSGNRLRIQKRYVLSLGTLEGRKNHLLLFQVWSFLIKEYGPSKVPDLVLVGRWGWNIDKFREACNQTNYLNGKIKVLEGLSDGEVADLYENCLLTIFPSFVEGWGLPVGESLFYRKPCIASREASIPEIGGALVEYIDPYDPVACTEVVKRVLFEDGVLSDLRDKIRGQFEPRLWKDFAADIVYAVTASDKPGTFTPFSPLGGIVYPIASPRWLSAHNISWQNRGATDLLDMGWKFPDALGASFEQAASLDLSKLGEANLRLFLNLRCEGASEANIVISVGEHEETFVIGSEAQWINFPVTIPEKAMLAINTRDMDRKSGQQVSLLYLAASRNEDDDSMLMAWFSDAMV